MSEFEYPKNEILPWRVHWTDWQR